jgi:hypothetical protein
MFFVALRIGKFSFIESEQRKKRVGKFEISMMEVFDFLLFYSEIELNK